MVFQRVGEVPAGGAGVGVYAIWMHFMLTREDAVACAPLLSHPGWVPA